MEKNPLIAKYEELNPKLKVVEETSPALSIKANHVYHTLLYYANKIKEGKWNPTKIVTYEENIPLLSNILPPNTEYVTYSSLVSERVLNIKISLGD